MIKSQMKEFQPWPASKAANIASAAAGASPQFCTKTSNADVQKIADMMDETSTTRSQADITIVRSKNATNRGPMFG